MTVTDRDVHIRVIRQHRMLTRDLINASAGWDFTKVVEDELKRRIVKYLLDHDLRPVGKIGLQTMLLKPNPDHDPDLMYSPLHVTTADDDWEFWRMEASVKAVPA